MSRDSMFNARFGALSSGLGSYPSRTVRGMYQQEQQIAKAEGAGLIITAADLQHMHSCECCGENEAYPDGLCAKCWNELKAHNE